MLEKLLLAPLMLNPYNLVSEQYLFHQEITPTVQVNRNNSLEEKLLADGEKFLKEEKYNEAIKAYRGLLRLSSNEEQKIKAWLGLGKAYFEKAGKDIIEEYYETSIKYFDRVTSSSLEEEIKREAKFYKAKALWYCIEDKKPKEAEEIFKSIIDYGINHNILDQITEFSLFAVGEINFKYSYSGDLRFSMNTTKESFTKLKQMFPNGDKAKHAISRLIEIEKESEFKKQ